MDDEARRENLSVIRAALGTKGETLQALALLLYALDTIHRVLIEQRNDVGVLDELRCLASVRAELMMALRVEAGVGPFEDFDAVSVVDWMVGPSTAACRRAIENVWDLAARDIRRLLDYEG